MDSGWYNKSLHLRGKAGASQAVQHARSGLADGFVLVTVMLVLLVLGAVLMRWQEAVQRRRHEAEAVLENQLLLEHAQAIAWLGLEALATHSRAELEAPPEPLMRLSLPTASLPALANWEVFWEVEAVQAPPDPSWLVLQVVPPQTDLRFEALVRVETTSDASAWRLPSDNGSVPPQGTLANVLKPAGMKLTTP